MRAGIPMVVCDGRIPGVVVDAAQGRECGTVFAPGDDTLPARKLWIAMGRRPAGTVVIDEGAVRALRQSSASLLPAGVRAVRGVFSAGDTVVLEDTSGAVIGRGLTGLSSADLEAVKGMKTSQIAEEHPGLAGIEVVHRDSLAIL
jgi:glutamate 5-kinase